MFQTTMTTAHLDILEQLDELKVHTDYSGRCMYGATCFGIETDEPITAVIQMTRELIEAFGIDDDDATADLLDALAHGARMDSLGLQSIVYWPHIQVDR